MHIKHKNLSAGNSGYALLELLFYVSFFAAMSLAVISAMITMSGSFRETAIHANLAESSGIMERMAREIRGADSIALISAEDLKLNTTDESGVSKTVEFLRDGTNLKLLEGGVLVGNLNAPGIALHSLSFTQITTPVGTAVKVYLTLGSENDRLARIFDFYDTAVLRGNY